MGREGGEDAVAIFVELGLEGVQDFDQALGQQALGGDHGGAGGQGVGVGEQRQPLRGRVGAPQAVGVEELFPLALPGVLQRPRRGKLLHQGPGAGFGPVVEGCQRGG